MLRDGLRFVRAARVYLRDQIDVPAIEATVRERDARRELRFLDVLDRAVWPFTDSPYRKLLDAAGLDAGTVHQLVDREGLEGALDALLSAGVYVSYEEFMGSAPARRGSATFDFAPGDFANPLVVADYMATTGGSRSRGTAIPSSFVDLRTRAINSGFGMLAWGGVGIPAAIWFPALPSATGINASLQWALDNNAPERWFSQVPPNASSVSARKRMSNLLLPLAAVGTGIRLPWPRLTTDPAPVLAWCRDVLTRHPRGVLGTYPTSAVRLAELALAEGVSLDGLLIAVAGEPLTHAKRARLEAAGMRPVNFYGFTQLGGVAIGCPESRSEEVHVYTHDFAVRLRRRPRADGVEVGAFCWTRVDVNGPMLGINLENDDFGVLVEGAADCGCSINDTLRRPTRLRDIRGLSKIVAGGTTLPGEVFERLAEAILPARFGGSAVDYQFAESEIDGATRLVLRVDPVVGDVADDALVAAVEDALRSSEAGVLATDVWAASGRLAVQRIAPTRTPVGKILPFETLRRD